MNTPRPRIAIAIASAPRPVTFEWIADSRIGRDCELAFALMNPGPTPIEDNLRARGCRVHRIPYAGRRDLPRATLEMTRWLADLKPAAIHTHLVDANLAGLTAARLTGVPRRILTRHHSDPYHLHHKHAQLYDRYANHLATDLVVACENVARVLTDLEGVPASKLRRIPFGIRFADYDSVHAQDGARIAAARARHGATGRGPVIGMVSRYLEIKGLQYAIPAFGRILREHPGAYLVIANAHGAQYGAQVRALLERLPAGSYREVAYEEDMPAFYAMADVFVHVPTDAKAEAFGQAYTEALAAGAPCVFTLSGVAPEFIRDGHNAAVVPFRDADAIYQAVRGLLADSDSARKMAERGRADVRRRFSFDDYVERLYQLYAGSAKIPGRP